MKQNHFPMKKIIMLFFVLSIVLNLMAQNKINLDTLNIEQLNIYLSKANNMSITGSILAIAGGATSATTFILLINYALRHGFFEPDQTEPNTYAIINLCGDAALIAGIPLILIGNHRKEKAQIALKKFDLKTDNSMAVGLGLTVRF
jgi:hypothetical protein